MTGEIKIQGMDASQTASLMKDNPLWNKTYFHVFDVVGANANKPFSERVRIIEETVDAACQSIKDCPLIAQPQIIMESRDQILAFYRDVLGKSGEGLVITNPDSKYDAGKKRSKERVKLKGRNDAEGKVIGYNMGGKIGKLRSLVVRFNGIEFSLGIGLKKFHREDPETYFPIGTLVKFSYRELTPNGKPKDAHFVDIRDPADMNTLSGGDLKQRIQELERSSDNRYEYLKIQIKNLEQKMRNFVSDALNYRDTNDDYWKILQKHINFTYNEHITKFNKHITKLENLENRFDTLIEGPDGPVRGDI